MLPIWCAGRNSIPSSALEGWMAEAWASLLGRGFAWLLIRQSCSSFWYRMARLPPLAVRLETSEPGPVGSTHQWTSAAGTPLV